jgi:tRNA nucleotidyltransferase (CCA-adding enzyme)
MNRDKIIANSVHRGSNSDGTRLVNSITESYPHYRSLSSDSDEIGVAEKIAKEVSLLGGDVYYVGGYVRDQWLGVDNKDIDIEVFGIKPEALMIICKKYGIVDEVGASFGILKIHGYDLDISMPRSEQKTGEGHKEFVVSVNPFLSAEDAARRRDFTINSIMKNVLTGEYSDPYHGLHDLKHNLLRHIDDNTFIEDPLRVFRAAQFAARFHLKINERTLLLCKSIDTSSLSAERIFEETNKALLKSNKPSIYFNTLREMKQLDSFFPILKDLIGVKQNQTWHPEGDVWNHTMVVIDKATNYRKDSSYPLGFMYAALFHDIGKFFTTTSDLDGNIHAYNHEIVGADHLAAALSKLTNHKRLETYAKNMVQQHMKPHTLYKHSSIKSTNRFFDNCISPKDSIMLSVADTINEKELLRFELGWWDERLKIYEEIKAKPEVTGQDLIDLGYVPGPVFKDILTTCHNIHLAGISKDDILRQIPSIIKGIHSRKKNG